MIVAADTGDQAVQSALNLAYLVLGVAIGAVAGVVLAFVISLVVRAVLGRTRIISALVRRTRGPFYWALIAWGAWVGFNIGLSIDLKGADASKVQSAGLVSLGHDLLRVLAIVATTWVVYAAMWVVEDAARLRHAADGGVSRRFETQAQVLRRLLQALVVLVGVATVVLVTFPGAQRAVSTLLASAGVVSVIAGLAAQSTLGNVFAGIQLAFTDAIRVGDVVVVGPNQDSGSIEEITLTYVVVRVWDERRLIMPSTEFAAKPFENWTRRAARQLGTVELTLDWAAPMAQIREKVEHLLLATDLWDGRTWSAQMTASDATSVTVRVLVSAKDSGTLWDLRCYLRENLIAWIASDEAWVRPVDRYQPQETVTVTHDTSREVVARLATELSDIAGPDTTAGGGSSGTEAQVGTSPDATPDGSGPIDAFHAARVHAARRKAKRARRRALASRQREAAAGASKAAGTPNAAVAAGDATVPDSQRTRVFTAEELREIARRYDEATTRRLAEQAPAIPSSGNVSSAGNVGNDGSAGDTDGATPAQVEGARPVPATGTTASPSSMSPDGTPVPGAAIAGPATPAATPAQDVQKGVTTQDAHPDASTQDAHPDAPTPGRQPPAVGKGERLYSGSPDAEERRAIFSGPGDDVIAEREQTAMMRSVRSGSSLTGTSTPPSDEGAAAVAQVSPGSLPDEGRDDSTPRRQSGRGADDSADDGADGGDGDGALDGRRADAGDGAVDATRVMPAIHPPKSGAQEPGAGR